MSAAKERCSQSKQKNRYLSNQTRHFEYAPIQNNNSARFDEYDSQNMVPIKTKKNRYLSNQTRHFKYAPVQNKIILLSNRPISTLEKWHVLYQNLLLFSGMS